MAAERLPMRKLREILRLRLERGLSGRTIARSPSMNYEPPRNLRRLW